MMTMSFTTSLKRLPAPTALSLLLSFLEERCFISYLSYLDSISLKISSNCWTERHVNDLNSNGFLDNLSWDNKGRTSLHTIYRNKAVLANYARDLVMRNISLIAFLSLLHCTILFPAKQMNINSKLLLSYFYSYTD
jgi:hypothetical protein